MIRQNCQLLPGNQPDIDIPNRTTIHKLMGLTHAIFLEDQIKNSCLIQRKTQQEKTVL